MTNTEIIGFEYNGPSAFLFYRSPKVEFKDCTFSNINLITTHLFNARFSTLSMTGTHFDDVVAGVIKATQTDMTMIDCSLKKYYKGDSPFQFDEFQNLVLIKDSTFENCISSIAGILSETFYDGGVFELLNCHEATFDHNSFISNKGKSGGAISFNNDQVVTGGAVYVIKNCIFDSNVALDKGGAVSYNYYPP